MGEQKDKNTFKNNSQSEYFIFNAAVCNESPLVLFLKTGTHDVSSGVIFHIQTESKYFRIIRGGHGIVVLIN